MTTFKLIGIAILTILGVGHEQKHEVHFTVDDGHPQTRIFMAKTDGDDTQFRIMANGQELDLDLSHMELGDTETYQLEDGTPVEVTRTDSGYDLNIDGKVIQLSDHHMDIEMKMDLGVDADSDNVVIGLDNLIVEHLDDAHEDNVVISGVGDLDESVKQEIRDLLQDAGIEKSVKFLDHAPKFLFINGDNGGPVWHGKDGLKKIEIIQDGIHRQIKSKGRTIVIESDGEEI